MFILFINKLNQISKGVKDLVNNIAGDIYIKKKMDCYITLIKNSNKIYNLKISKLTMSTKNSGCSISTNFHL